MLMYSTASGRQWVIEWQSGHHGCLKCIWISSVPNLNKCGFLRVTHNNSSNSSVTVNLSCRVLSLRDVCVRKFLIDLWTNSTCHTRSNESPMAFYCCSHKMWSGVTAQSMRTLPNKDSTPVQLLKTQLQKHLILETRGGILITGR